MNTVEMDALGEDGKTIHMETEADNGASAVTSSGAGLQTLTTNIKNCKMLV